MKNKKRVIAASIDEEIYLKLEIFKEKKMMTRSRIIEEALKNYLKERENENN